MTYLCKRIMDRFFQPRGYRYFVNWKNKKIKKSSAYFNDVKQWNWYGKVVATLITIKNMLVLFNRLIRLKLIEINLLSIEKKCFGVITVWIDS